MSDYSFDDLVPPLQNLAEALHGDTVHFLVNGPQAVYVAYTRSDIVAAITYAKLPESFGVMDDMFTVSVYTKSDVQEHGDDHQWMISNVRERLLGRSLDEVVAFLERYKHELYQPQKKRNGWSI
jgi:hypothetical protein